MLMAKLLTATIWGSALGWAMVVFAQAGDWGMFALTIALFVIPLYLVLWIRDMR